MLETIVKEFQYLAVFFCKYLFSSLLTVLHIELISCAMLESMVEEVQYLAVFFCKHLLSSLLASN
jgi:hypothetical protein